MGIIFNIQKFCLNDGDGIRTNVFFKGCPLRCIWCHNPEGLSKEVSVSYNREKCTVCGRCIEECSARSINGTTVVFDREACKKCGKCVSNCLQGANEVFGRDVTASEVMSEVLRDKDYYDISGGGMTLSGGEPSMQEDFALELIKIASENGVSTAVETCGIGGKSFYESCVGEGVTFLFDIKCVDAKKHKELTGVSNERILDNLEYLFSVNADVILRLPMIPGVNDTDEDLLALCEFLQKNKGKYRYAEIMPYHSFGAEKSRRIGNENVFEISDANDKDKARWRAFFEKYDITFKIA